MISGAQTILITDVFKHEWETLHALSPTVESLSIEFAMSVTVADLSGHKLCLHKLRSSRW